MRTFLHPHHIIGNQAVHRMLHTGVNRYEAGPTDSTPHSGVQDSSQQVESAGLSPAEVPAVVREVLAAPGQALDTAARSVMESRLGCDFSGVRVHTDAKAAAAAWAIDAQAYTAGHNVVFGAGQYSPDTATGQNLLAHELTHVAQQQTAAQKTGLLPGGRRAAGGGAAPLIIQRQVAPEGDKPASSTHADDVALHSEVRGHEIILTKTLVRDGLESKLVTVFNPSTMTQTQRLFRRSAQSPAWTDVTTEALRETDFNPPGVEPGELSVEWNMPLARPASSARSGGEILAEAIVAEIPPSLVIPYVKDSILTEHFEFTPPGENSYQHWANTIGRRWSATGARKTGFWLNKVVSATSLGVAATGAVTSAGKGVSAIKAAAQAEKLAAERAASVSARLAAESAALEKGALQPFNKSLTNAGRALTKHPEVANLTKETLRNTLKTDAAINQAAQRSLSTILKDGVRTTATLPRYGQVIQYQLPGGFGARWYGAGDKFGQFIGFINP